MFISKVELTPVTGLTASLGFTHHLTLTIDHPWPRPKWWGKGQTANSEVDALLNAAPAPVPLHFRGEQPGQFLYVASGGALSWMEGQKLKRFKTEKGHMAGYGYWKDDRLVFQHSLQLQDVPAKPELTFDGLYMVEGQKPLHLHRIIRRAGEQLQWNRSRDPGGKILSMRATPFKAEMWSNSPHEDECEVTIITSHPPRSIGATARR